MDKTLIKSLLFATLTASLIAICYQHIDRPVAEIAYHLKGTIWHELAKQISLCANGILFQAILAVGFLLGACDALRNGLTRRSKSILYICTTVAAAMFIGDVLKDLFGRARPPLLFADNIYGFFPLTEEYLYNSFPSGHSIRIFSSMTALAFILPRLRIPALALAGLVGISRVFALKHYPSDVLLGAFIGITVSIWAWRILYPYGYRKNN